MNKDICKKHEQEVTDFRDKHLSHLRSEFTDGERIILSAALFIEYKECLKNLIEISIRLDANKPMENMISVAIGDLLFLRNTLEKED